MKLNFAGLHLSQITRGDLNAPAGLLAPSVRLTLWPAAACSHSVQYRASETAKEARRPGAWARNRVHAYAYV